MARGPDVLQNHISTTNSDCDYRYNLPPDTPEVPVHELGFQHPQVTGFRALVLTFMFGLGIPKAFLMFLRRNDPADANAGTSLDLAFSANCATSLYWLGMYEKCHPPWMRRWLFSAPNTQTPRSLGNEWHYPRLTTYRTVALTFPILFGSWKAVLTYMGHQTPPNMLLDWQIGIVGILWLFWLGWFEECHPEWMHLIFAEDNNEQDVPKRYPGFTVYRVLVMIVIASFVISKAVQTSEGEYLGANWVDVILVVFCIPGLFWLGLYQKNCPESWRWFFVDEYCSSLCVLPAGISFVLVRIAQFIFYGFAMEPYFAGLGWFCMLLACWFIAPSFGDLLVFMVVVVGSVCVFCYFFSFMRFRVERIGAVPTRDD